MMITIVPASLFPKNWSMLAVFIVLIFGSLCNSKRFVYGDAHTYDVMNFGAVGNNSTDDTKAFIDTWKAACGATGPAAILVPKDKIFLLNTIDFDGTGCKFSSIDFQILGQIVAPRTSNWAQCKPQWMFFVNINGLTINGNGMIDGNGDTYWSTLVSNATVGDCQTAPAALEIDNCNNVTLDHVNSKNSPGIHIHIKGCNDVHISNVHITAPGDSPNTDGINVRRSERVTITDSVIGTGDDCIAINDGCKIFNVSNIACGPGHGISVGSLGKGGSTETVEDVYVKNCSFTGTTIGARIKSWIGGSGYARRITYDEIILNNAKNPIIIDQKYNPGITRNDQAVEISDVSFLNFNGTSASEEAIQLICAPGIGCSGIEMKNVNIRGSNSKVKAVCENAHGRQTETSPSVPCLTPVGDISLNIIDLQLVRNNFSDT